jgi:membrane-associated phospholipid phosphatase
MSQSGSTNPRNDCTKMYRGPERFLAPISFRYFMIGSIKSAVLFTIFSVVYYAADWFNINRAISFSLYFWWELEYYPFLAWSSLVYESPVVVIAALPFIIRNNDFFNSYIKQYLICIFICGIIFVFIPTVQDYPPIANSPRFDTQKIAWWADQANGYYNCFPSLHVINVLLQARWAAIGKSTSAKAGLWGWAALVSVSTLTMHSHYLADIVGAILLVFLVEKVTKGFKVEKFKSGACPEYKTGNPS